MKSKIPDQSRRNFLKNSIVAGTLFPLIHGKSFAIESTQPPDRLKVHLFSKHLQFLNYRDMAEAAAKPGFDGVDLTVRPEGHVLPERVAEDLPKAVEALRRSGLASLMMTTAVDDAEDPADKKVLQVAAGLGFKYYRMNWFSYPEDKPIPETIQQLSKKVKDLSHLNKELKLTGCYQNHAGTGVGSTIWEVWELLKEADKEYMGLQYDIRHAVVEGGFSWPNGLRLVQSQIKSIALKDFKWEQKNGKWDTLNTPIGEGMVDFKRYFKLLKQYNINVPVSLHFEYSLGGAESGGKDISIDKKEIFKIMKKDLQKIHQLWQQS